MSAGTFPWAWMVLAAGLAGCGAKRPSAAEAPPSSGASARSVTSAASGGAAPTGAREGLVDEEDRPSTGSLAPRAEVTIKILADGRRHAHVLWGRKDLGVAPLEVKRPRGSGPLDLVISAEGYLPLHTRVFTDHDETLPVRLYSEDEAAGLLGHPQ